MIPSSVNASTSPEVVSPELESLEEPVFEPEPTSDVLDEVVLDDVMPDEPVLDELAAPDEFDALDVAEPVELDVAPDETVPDELTADEAAPVAEDTPDDPALDEVTSLDESVFIGPAPSGSEQPTSVSTPPTPIA